MERVNARLKVFWGADDGNISGARRFRALVGMVMVVHAGFATLLAKAPRRGTLGKLHLGPVQKALAAAEAKQAQRPASASICDRLRCPLEGHAPSWASIDTSRPAGHSAWDPLRRSGWTSAGAERMRPASCGWKSGWPANVAMAVNIRRVTSSRTSRSFSRP